MGLSLMPQSLFGNRFDSNRSRKSKSFFNLSKPPPLFSKRNPNTNNDNSNDNNNDTNTNTNTNDSNQYNRRKSISSRLSMTLSRTSLSRNSLSRQPGPRYRFKDLPPQNLLNVLCSLDSVPPPDQLSILTDRLTSDPNFLSSLVDILATPPSPFLSSNKQKYDTSSTTTKPSRDRVASHWVVSSLFRHGGASVKSALASDPSNIRRLASVFVDSKAHVLDPAHAMLVSDVLRTLLQSHSRETCTALALRESFIPALVRHIAVQPAADLLPRLIGTRAFPAREGGISAPLLPCHKSAIAAMASTRVQDMLADVFIHACVEMDSNISSNSSSASCDSLGDVFYDRETIRSCCNIMAEIGARAACLPFKHEEPDERTDRTYASGLGIVTSVIFNDAKKYLDPFFTPQPFIRVCLRAFSTDFFNDSGVPDPFIVIPPLNMLTHVMSAFRIAEESMEERYISVPQDRTLSFMTAFSTKPDVDYSVLSSALIPVWKRLVDLIKPKNSQQQQHSSVGRVRLAALDVIHEAVLLFEEATVLEILSPNMTQAFVDALKTFSNNDVLIAAVSQCLVSAINRFELLADYLTSEHPWIQNVVNEMLIDNAAAKPLVDLFSRSSAPIIEDDKTDDWNSWITMVKQEKSTGSAALQRRKSESELADAGEDFAQELFVMTAIGEISSNKLSAPPTDDFVAHAVDVGATHHRHRGLLTMLHLKSDE